MARLHVSLVVNWDVPCGIMIKIPLMGMFRDSLCVSFDSESLHWNHCKNKNGRKTADSDLMFRIDTSPFNSVSTDFYLFLHMGQ